MKKIIKTSLAIISAACVIQAANAAVTESKAISLRAESTAVNTEMVIKDNFIKSKYTSAANRFMQGNVKASHDDFEDLVSKAAHDDYVFLMYGMKMSEFGFFDLTDELISRLDTNLYTQNYVNDIKKYYYPSGMVNQKDILALSDAYAGIVYTDLAIETTSELLNSTQIGESDYKNYLISLGYYKSNETQKALKYINDAIIQNDKNISYKVLQAKILADLGKNRQALKVLSQIKKSGFTTVDFQDKIRAAEEYVLYKVSKDEALKDYHLSYYYHLQDRSFLASKVLQSAVLKAKEHSAKIFSLLGKIYYDNDEITKAQEYAQRAYKENHRNYLAVMTLGDLSFDERNYEDALKYYKEAKKLTKDSAPKVGMAKTYLALDQNKKSKKMYEKLLKKQEINEDLLADSLKLYPQRADYYLPAIASVDITNNEMWLGLANLAIKDGNYNMAQTYLNNSYYIDENNFKYYYYLSQVLRAKGDDERANLSLIRCSRLNSDYEAGLGDAYEK